MGEEEGSFGLAMAEKLFGFMILITGAFTAYYTFTSEATLQAFTGLFGVLGIILLVLGLFMLIAKTE